MRPPEFTGGNRRCSASAVVAHLIASMRPPEFTGGNIAFGDLESAIVAGLQ